MKKAKRSGRQSPGIDAAAARRIQEEYSIVGREFEIKQLLAAIGAGRNVLVEGPVGAGKTVLAAAVAGHLGRKLIRIDGDARFTEQKLTGWFDPNLVLKKGFSAKTFCAGPLLEAMQEGAILFINELNRMPEAVQNVLLPAIDEGLVHVPQLGEARAKPGFLVVATQNPREFVATSHLSEALLDRMEWVHLDYQGFDEECEIVLIALGGGAEGMQREIRMAVGLVRLTRSHPKIRRGASVRAAIAILKILRAATKTGPVSDENFWNAVKLALPTRIELSAADDQGGYEKECEAVLRELFEELKKNSPLRPETSLTH